jgi:hypothetical protein
MLALAQQGDSEPDHNSFLEVINFLSLEEGRINMKQAFYEKESYQPNHWLDSLMLTLKVKSDAALARALQVPASTISKVRNKHMPINSSLLLSAHELTEISIRDLRVMMGDVHTRYWQGEIRIRGGNRLRSAACNEDRVDATAAQVPGDVAWVRGVEKYRYRGDSAI